MGGLSSCFVVLIVLLLAADILFVSLADFKNALLKPEIQHAFGLTLTTCTMAALLSIWVATPMGYLLSRFHFPGRTAIVEKLPNKAAVHRPGWSSNCGNGPRC